MGRRNPTELNKVKAQFAVLRDLITRDTELGPEGRAMLAAGLDICESLVTSIVRIADAAAPIEMYDPDL